MRSQNNIITNFSKHEIHGSINNTSNLNYADITIGPIWIIETANGHLRTKNKSSSPTHFRLYRLHNGIISAISEIAISSNKENDVKTLILEANIDAGILVCSYRTISHSKLIDNILGKNFPNLKYVFECNSNNKIEYDTIDNIHKKAVIKDLYSSLKWQQIPPSGESNNHAYYSAFLGFLSDKNNVNAFALSIGNINGYTRGYLFGISNITCSVEDFIKKYSHILLLIKDVRLVSRKVNRDSVASNNPRFANQFETNKIQTRSNRKIAAAQDEKINTLASSSWSPDFKSKLANNGKNIKVMELFAGAGGMGLGFLLSNTKNSPNYNIIASAEISPIFTETLRINHSFMEKTGLVSKGLTPAEHIPLDLCKSKSQDYLAYQSKVWGGVDLLIGGPPCQGFSNANRNSWSSTNPNNRLVDAFLDSVAKVTPKILLMENVQGILWTAKEGSDNKLSVAEHVLQKLNSLGYLVFPKLLDAVWYGVPQNRNRFFLIGLHQDLGYKIDDFGEWGPFPKPTHGPGTTKPYVTVRDAISDLPFIYNGESTNEINYLNSNLIANEFVTMMRNGAPENLIWDHVTSKHADYVIDRYKNIKEGQNWQAVKDMMTNYANVERTHSNIYKRLVWDEPSITIGHYRKSMLIHPSQHRGLSLREACRLQSFPDWFRFAGSLKNMHSGLMYKQQQLANAVCPNVTKAVAEFIMKL